MTTTCSRHELFVYDADDAYERLFAPYLEEGHEQGDALIAVFVPEKEELLRDALGPAADAVAFDDAWQVYTRPEAVLGRYDTVTRRLLHDGARSIRVIGELPAREAQQNSDAWMLYEGLLNHAFTHLPVRVACAYDERIAPASLLDAARRTHPHVHHGDWIGGEWERSDVFDPTAVVRSLTLPGQPLEDLLEIEVNGDMVVLRRRLVEAMTAAGLPADKVTNLLLAAGEAAANAQLHGHGLRALRAGRINGDFVCEVYDNGPGFDDPLAGHLPPRAGAVGGGGLWVARQLTSRLEFLAAPSGGMITRLWA
jgi:anti-sigma regulatory factor (Ser/Thr protein kinase)